MTFIFNMARREMRASGLRLALFFLCIAVGVGSMVSLRSFTQVLKASVARDARGLVAADVRAQMNEPWKPETKSVLERYSASPLVTAHTEIIETQTMVRAANDEAARPVMVELRGVQKEFPLHGQVRLSGGLPFAHASLAGRGAVVSPGLLPRLNVKVGDALKIGLSTFTIRGVAERVPGNGLNFSPMPRVLVAYDEVAAAGLTGFGSRVRYAWLFKTQEGQEQALLRQLAREFRSLRISSLGSFRNIETWLSRRMDNIDGFVGLIGLAMVVLGGIGIASVTRVFVQQRIRTIAVLKCLGGRNRKVLGAYLAQVVALSLVGGVLGIGLAEVITLAGGRYAAQFIPLDWEPRVTWPAALHGIGVGLLVALLFSMAPLVEIRDVKPILVLRHHFSPSRRRIDWLRIVARLLPGAGVLALAVWQSGTYRRAGVLVGGIAATALFLNGAGEVLIRVLRRPWRIRSFVLRQGLGSLHRPGNQTKAVLFTLGLSALFMIAVRLHQVNLRNEYTLDLSALSADMFLIDVQADQRQAAEAAFARLGATDLQLAPIARARFVGLKRRPGNATRVPANRIAGEYRLSSRVTLGENETIVAGTFWDGTPASTPEISIEEGFGQWLALEIGDALIFDLAGRRIEAPVTSIRRLGRRLGGFSSLVRFDVLFRPGVLESAPHMFVGALKGPSDRTARARLQNQFMEQFPNVTLIDALDDIEEIRKRVDVVSFAISILGGFVFVCGVLILVGSIAMTKVHRLYEAAILKTLGAKKKVIVYITIVEYGVLGLLAGIVGSAGSIGVTWAMSRFGRMQLPWHLQPSINVIGIVVTVLLVTVVGVAASWDVLMKKPLGILREE